MGQGWARNGALTPKLGLEEEDAVSRQQELIPCHNSSFLLDQQSEFLGLAVLEGRSPVAGHELVMI